MWANVSTNAQVVGVEGNLVTLGFTQIGAMKNFTGGGKDAVVATALADVLGGRVAGRGRGRQRSSAVSWGPLRAVRGVRGLRVLQEEPLGRTEVPRILGVTPPVLLAPTPPAVRGRPPAAPGRERLARMATRAPRRTVLRVAPVPGCLTRAGTRALRMAVQALG
ncbi:hypothetical protein ACFSTC_57630 [Nonomuraea ferruginea]